MPKTVRISVCIPTCDRPEYLDNAIRSALQQTPAPFEVLIGDDSSDRQTTILSRRFEEEGAPIRYIWNEPSLGQANNVDRLFRRATGNYIVLLHDDDQLLDGALDELLSCFKNHKGVVGAFGKQQIVNHQGDVKQEETTHLNEGYYRTEQYTGLQSSALRSAIIGQFPNDGYMLQAKAAQQVGYDHGAGDACDFAFNVEYAKATGGDFCFTNTLISQYRWSEESVLRGSGTTDAAYQVVKILQDLPDEVMEDTRVLNRLRSLLPAAIMQAAENGYPEDGLQWFFGPYHRHKILTPHGAWRLLNLVHSYFVS